MKKIFYILFTSFFILAGYFSINRLINKPDLPFEYESNNSEIYFDNFSSLPGKNKIISIDDYFIKNEFQLEFFLDGKHINDNVKVLYLNIAGGIVNSSIILTPYYHDSTFVFVTGLVGYVFLLLGLFVILKQQAGKQAVFLYWTLILFGTATLTSPGHYDFNGDLMSYIIRTLHVVSYSGGGLLFVLFILSFPVDRLKQKKNYTGALTVLTLSAVLFASITQISSFLNINNVYLFDISWDIILALLTISLIYGSYNMIKTYITLTNREDKKKINWIIWGLVAGVSPYILVWVIPYIFNLPIIINEEYLLLFLIIVPVSFVIAVIKYQVLEIELVVKRSFVYSVLSICIIGIYVGILYLSNVLFDYILGSETKFINLLAVLITALLFNPLRNRLNQFADKVFYREKYRFDQTLINFTSSVKEFKDLSALSKFVLDYILKIIPVTGIASVSWIEDRSNIKIFKPENNQNSYGLLNDPDFKGLLLYSSVPVARPNCMNRDIGYVSTASDILKKHDISICIPLMLGRNNIIGSILCGEKLSGLRYSWPDIELLTALADAFATEIDRIILHEKVKAEEMELAKLDELNKIKSFYVASVSHDLKTPLTSIKVFTELMQSEKRIPVEKRNEYLKIIEGETDRLTRLIDNVLDFTKIEKGIKQYSFSSTDLNKILKCVFKSIEYTLKINKFKIRINITSGNLKIYGDTDAIKTALFNIISNSIKYSQVHKCIEVSSGIQNNSAYIEIGDKGIGIPEDDQTLIFDPFFRSSSTEMNRVKGAGLGLAIVKHVMDAHKGKIELFSKVNEGTKIRLIFPLSKHE